VQVWGHRGSRQPGPQNSPAAVRAALVAGADGSEVDVRRTRDGGLVCVHDPVVAARPVIDQTVRELETAGVRPLAEVIEAAIGGRLVIEVKNDPREPDFSAAGVSAQMLMDALEKLIGPAGQSTQDVVISSFDPASLAIAHEAGRRTGLLTLPLVSIGKGLGRALAAGNDELHAHVSMVAGTRSVAAVHEAGLRLAVWTVTSDMRARRLRKLGVDAVICDDPASVVRALAAQSDKTGEPRSTG
jgi:glycerophosphoryl diester phosphodiesterase